MMIILAICTLLGTYTAWSLYSLYRNYVRASKIGLPVLINPIDAMNPLWFLTQDVAYPLLTRLPFNLGEFAIRLKSNWTFIDRFKHHTKYGIAFVEATPANVRIFIADPTAMEDLSKRRNEFYKPPVIYSLLDIYGPNLDSVNGKVWDRHKRITVPPFNEKNSSLVWQATLDQASQMLQKWYSSGKMSTMQVDAHAVALNVLCYAGFGLAVDFIDEHDLKSDDTKDSARGRYGYRAAIRILLENFVTLVLHQILLNSRYPVKWMWGSMRRLTQVKGEFKAYMQDLIRQETILYEQGHTQRHNLLSSLIRANIEAEKGASAEAAVKEVGLSARDDAQSANISAKALTQDEIYGNLFIFNLAGHDTTAGTVHFALVLLSANPEVQEWLSEEINSVRAMSDDPTFYYETTFPQLKRCLAVMYETLRLYGPVQTLPRATPPGVTAPLRVGDQTYVIPPDTQIISNFSALHTHPEHWGPDPLAFRPSRFIESNTDAHNTPTAVKSENFHEASTAGSFVAWNRGQRQCPGRKFSQVEFVATMFILFADSRSRLVTKPGETQEQAKARVMKRVNNAPMQMTLKMDGDVEVEWFKKI